MPPRVPRLVKKVSRVLRKLGLASSTPKEQRPAALSNRIAALEQTIGDLDRHLRVRTVMDWIAQAHVAAGPLVSVILPTRNRCEWLRRAIASVQAQAYVNWELIVVDDGSTDGTASMLSAGGDERVRGLRTSAGGVCAARNAALERAQGDLIAYLDDDNMMHPQWLKSVVWAFAQRPEATVLYGAFVVDDAARLHRQSSGEFPRLYFWPYDHQSVAVHNIADIGCIAHRAGLPDARFDETLREMGDWDLFLRLTRDAPPIALPAIACFYTTDAPNRLSNGPSFQADLDAVRSKNKR